ncbi:hypothetical protein GUJ93_ZPchr0013g35483 [Zizania palustris]|uniref:Uncharacterized protein n=1 Tax=Zizania palustris TaxID=103762 RepID=A0A8J5WX15_ZIZPA|nr:hypothetical protein GUJ93_ZPchr0013g35483 [Zizania palustris]
MLRSSAHRLPHLLGSLRLLHAAGPLHGRAARAPGRSACAASPTSPCSGSYLTASDGAAFRLLGDSSATWPISTLWPPVTCAAQVPTIVLTHARLTPAPPSPTPSAPLLGTSARQLSATPGSLCGSDQARDASLHGHIPRPDLSLPAHRRDGRSLALGTAALLFTTDIRKSDTLFCRNAWQVRSRLEEDAASPTSRSTKETPPPKKLLVEIRKEKPKEDSHRFF